MACERPLNPQLDWPFRRWARCPRRADGAGEFRQAQDRKMLRLILGAPLAAACLCAAPVLALAAFDIDASRPLHRALRRAALAIFALGVVAGLKS